LQCGDAFLIVGHCADRDAEPSWQTVGWKQADNDLALKQLLKESRPVTTFTLSRK
jgi:hypothetical protein